MNEVYWAQSPVRTFDASVEGAIVDIAGKKYYRVRHYDRMPPFLMSVVSSSNHWMFVSSTGGLTCGRANPDRALFPYCTDDKVHDSAFHTGPKTCLLVQGDGRTHLWIPFRDGVSVYQVERNLYKSVYGSRLIFEEVNHDLDLVFSYEWAVGERFGFIKTNRILNTGTEATTVQVLDGIRNLLPPGVSQDMQTRLSTLLDAYKTTEVDAHSGAGIYALSSLPTDLAEPREALSATVACSVGLDEFVVLLSEKQVRSFCEGREVHPEKQLRGQRGAYFVQCGIELQPSAQKVWSLVADVGLGASSLVRYLDRLDKAGIEDEIEADISGGERRLQQLAGSADGLQYTRDEQVSGRHFANTLFNIMRGGTFIDEYNIPVEDFLDFVSVWNRSIVKRCEELMSGRSGWMARNELLDIAESGGDADIRRLAMEYLPLTFSRRHGDPSRPWNRFHIDIRTESGKRKLAYEGNWRDIFQNWEALGFSYPEFLDGSICRFLNASTVDGYNPYRVSRDGFDWEVFDPDDGWSNIGYWGDHQVVYLLRLLMWSGRFFPGRTSRLLSQKIFVFADVPYRIKPYRELLLNPRDSIVYDTERADQLAARTSEIGSDGKLLTLTDGSICRASMLEKMLVTVLCKLGNFVPGGGIWMNTQRPEWNDANNALAGYGLSMVTVAYLRRLIVILAELVEESGEKSFEVAEEISDWLHGIYRVLSETRIDAGAPVSPESRKAFMDEMGRIGSDYRERIYQRPSGKQTVLSRQQILDLFSVALAHLDHTIRTNRRSNGLYHSYNLVQFDKTAFTVKHLREMLEGQVAVLSSGLLDAADSVALLETLKESDLYREDQQSFLLYPDRKVVGFLEKNVVPEPVVNESRALQRELSTGRGLLVEQDSHGKVHFNSALTNSAALGAAIDAVGVFDEDEKQEFYDIYESVFRHREFTGRSSTMYKYEGLGCIYWHMVSKLLLGVSEVANDARADGADESVLGALAAHIGDIRSGLGLHKTPAAYGAIPLDPYSHTPGFAGVQQPGMTGQVKEDILARFIELGVSIKEGCVVFEPYLLARDEFVRESGIWNFSTIHGQKEVKVDSECLAFSVCGTPVIYRLSDSQRIVIHADGAPPQVIDGGKLDRKWSRSLFERKGLVQKVIVDIPRASLR
jgi:hypothetical protein